MEIKITGKELKATEAIKDYVEKKSMKLEKYFGEELKVFCTIKTEGKDQIAEMQLAVPGDTYRAVTAHKDLYASIDKNIDILEGQIRKNKTKKDKQNMTESIRVKEDMQASHTKEIENEIIKSLFYDIKPISPEDAKLKLQEDYQNKFLPFINIETGKVNVMYKLKDGKNFGIVEPEA